MDVHYERGSAWTEHHRSIWTEDKIAELRELWNTGLSTRDIADQLGGEFTRSAVIGKAQPASASTAQGCRSRGRPKGSNRCCRPFCHRPRRYRRSRRHRRRCARCNWCDLEDHHCRFPIGDPHATRVLLLRGRRAA